MIYNSDNAVTVYCCIIRKLGQIWSSWNSLLMTNISINQIISRDPVSLDIGVHEILPRVFKQG